MIPGATTYPDLATYPGTGASTLVTVTSTIGATCNYTFMPQANEDVTGLGVTVPAMIRDVVQPDPGASKTLSVTLDNRYKWDVDLQLENAAPIVFSGFNPGSGGDLLTLLAAQGWTAA